VLDVVRARRIRLRFRSLFARVDFECSVRLHALKRLAANATVVSTACARERCDCVRCRKRDDFGNFARASVVDTVIHRPSTTEKEPAAATVPKAFSSTEGL